MKNRLSYIDTLVTIDGFAIILVCGLLIGIIPDSFIWLRLPIIPLWIISIKFLQIYFNKQIDKDNKARLEEK